MTTWREIRRGPVRLSKWGLAIRLRIRDFQLRAAILWVRGKEHVRLPEVSFNYGERTRPAIGSYQRVRKWRLGRSSPERALGTTVFFAVALARLFPNEFFRKAPLDGTGS